MANLHGMWHYRNYKIGAIKTDAFKYRDEICGFSEECEIFVSKFKHHLNYYNKVALQTAKEYFKGKKDVDNGILTIENPENINEENMEIELIVFSKEQIREIANNLIGQSEIEGEGEEPEEFYKLGFEKLNKMLNEYYSRTEIRFDNERVKEGVKTMVKKSFVTEENYILFITLMMRILERNFSMCIYLLKYEEADQLKKDFNNIVALFRGLNEDICHIRHVAPSAIEKLRQLD